MTDIISTRQADCKDCYRCLRACPVKAISFKGNQAKIEPDRCVLCGRCVVECPQKAKIVRNQTFKIKDYFSRKEPVYLSLAPSFPASFTQEAKGVMKLLEKSGFTKVEETAVGARYTVKAYKEEIAKSNGITKISTCCPVVVNLVEKYYPELRENLLPVLSPMVAHARHLKECYGNGIKVVFAGPCIAKLREAEENGLDAAMTFTQLKTLLDQVPIQGEEALKVFHERMETRMFPVHNGVLYAMKGQWGLEEEYWSIEGIENCCEILDALRKKDVQPIFIEMMACQGGCVGGPAIDSPYGLYKRKEKVKEFYQRHLHSPSRPLLDNLVMGKSFSSKAVRKEVFTEEEIRSVLVKMGKFTKGDERNCEGCGYKSCRDKAAAVLAGLAVPEMCIPYMRERAESLASTIVQSTPNSILVLDKEMVVRDFNPAAQKLFSSIPLKIGLKLSDYMNTQHYELVLEGRSSLTEQRVYYPEWGLFTRQIATPLKEDGFVMVIITDITQSEENRVQYQKMKEDVMVKAKEVINQQMMVAQTIAGLLGETTAETKATLMELLKHLEREEF
ncbi:[Fe-Fe] hydrogenase large subunit C-terminal domain-containing protein [Thermanaerosceptrum fracticalcis]|uniref:[Fe-Fe] hydrogenase large subunit C-terminal domain-containing protein n=1 Tax=Thermanaerosceptrum fracticalcis TaxID=1712410 RepID=UPI00068E6BA7|nr:[Fe-Fe] hydrogenase large subunit C-terminal domain-containing protein [Thermanaerosceptrum fracticalcis]